MSLLDCAVLLKESKKVKTKLLAEAFVKHAIPQIDPGKLQEAFVQQIKTNIKPELPIFSYKTTEITVDGSTAAEDSLCGQTVASMAYEFCDKLPCGTPIGKAISGWAACELLGMVLGPNIHVKTRFKCRNEDHPQWLGYTSEIVAQFQEKPLKRSASGLAWWPEAFLKELVTPAGPLSQLERSSESLLNALLALPLPQEEPNSSEGVVWTRDADGIMRCPGGGMNLQDPRTNVLWQSGLASDAPKDQTVPGGARRLFYRPLERDIRSALLLSRPDPILDFKHNSRTQKLPEGAIELPCGSYLDERSDKNTSYTESPTPLERVNTCVGDGSCYCCNNIEVKTYSYRSHSS